MLGPSTQNIFRCGPAKKMMTAATNKSPNATETGNGAFGSFALDNEQELQLECFVSGVSLLNEMNTFLYGQPYLQSGSDGWSRDGGGTLEGCQVSYIDFNTGKHMNFALLLSPTTAVEGGEGSSKRLAQHLKDRLRHIYDLNWDRSVCTAISDTASAALSTCKAFFVRDSVASDFYSICAAVDTHWGTMVGNLNFVTRRVRTIKEVEAECDDEGVYDDEMSQLYLNDQMVYVKKVESNNDIVAVNPRCPPMAFNYKTGKAISLLNGEGSLIDVPKNHVALIPGDEVVAVLKGKDNDVIKQTIAKVIVDGSTLEGGYAAYNPKNKLESEIKELSRAYSEEFKQTLEKEHFGLLTFIMRRGAGEAVAGIKCIMHVLSLMVAFGVGKIVKSDEDEKDLLCFKFIKEFDKMIAALATGARAEDLTAFQTLKNNFYPILKVLQRGNTRIIGVVEQLKRALVCHESIRNFPAHMKEKEDALKKKKSKKRKKSAVGGDVDVTAETNSQEFRATDATKTATLRKNIPESELWWKGLAEIAYLTDLFTYAVKMCQCENELSMGNTLLAILELFTKLYDINKALTLDEDESNDEPLKVEIFDIAKGSVSKDEVHYHERQTKLVPVREFQEVSKEVAKRLFKAFTHWIGLEMVQEECTVANVTTTRDKIANIPLSMLIPSLFDPRSRSIIRDQYLTSKSKKCCDKLILLQFIESFTWRRLNSREVVEPESEADSPKPVAEESDDDAVLSPCKKGRNSGDRFSSSSSSGNDTDDDDDNEILERYEHCWRENAGGQSRTSAPPPEKSSIQDINDGGNCNAQNSRSFFFKFKNKSRSFGFILAHLFHFFCHPQLKLIVFFS